MLRHRSLPWYYVWFTAIHHPRTATYHDLLNHASNLVATAYAWMILTGIAVGLAEVARQLVAPLPGQTQPPFALLLVVLPIVNVLGLVIVFTAVVCLEHVGAVLLGGEGSFADLLYLTAAYLAPMTFAVSLLILLTSLQLAQLLLLPVGAFQVMLGVVAVKAAHGFTSGRAIVAVVIVPTFAIILLGVLWRSS